MMGFRHQLQYLHVDDEKADTLPDERGAHVAGKRGRCRRVIRLLVRFFIGDFIRHVVLLNILRNQSGIMDQPGFSLAW